MMAWPHVSVARGRAQPQVDSRPLPPEGPHLPQVQYTLVTQQQGQRGGVRGRSGSRLACTATSLPPSLTTPSPDGGSTGLSAGPPGTLALLPFAPFSPGGPLRPGRPGSPWKCLEKSRN